MSEETKKVKRSELRDQFGSSRELFLGEIYGLRGWDVDELGRLTGVTYYEVFKPGVNTAVCGIHGGVNRPRTKYSAGGTIFYNNSITYALSSGGNVIKVKTSPEMSSKAEERTPHDMADCSCGYYAYLSESAKDSHYGTVKGVIRAFGKVTLGTEGFRAEKAELVALTVPGFRKFDLSPKSKKFISKFLLPADFFDDHPILTFLTLVPAVFFFIFGLPLLLGAAGQGAVQFIGLAMVLLSFYGFSLILANGKLNRNDFGRGSGTYAVDKPLTPREQAARFTKLYPGVKVYSSRRKMLKKHPLTKLDDFVESPVKPTLPDPDSDPEFWSR